MSPQFVSRFAPVSSPPPPESPYFARGPPSDLNSYQRSLYNHTLKQAQASSVLPSHTTFNGVEFKSQDTQTDGHYDEKHSEHIEHAR
jgi:hypothetical protein